jgi:hypothetical protein
VQGDHRLAGARPAGDHEDPAVRRSDDLVLLGLQGRHDLAHAARPAGGEGGEQRPVAHDVLGARPGAVQEFVGDGDDVRAVQGEVAAPTQAHRVRRSGRVEGAGGVGAPVDQQRSLAVVGLQAEPSDVQRAAVGDVDAPEAQPVPARVEGVQPALEQADARVALVQLGGVGRPPARGDHRR